MDLREIARTEKASKVLLELPKNLYNEAKLQIQNSKESLNNLSDIEKEMMEFSIFADQRDLASIKNLRITKLVKAATTDAYRDKPKHDSESMLPDEREFYESVIKGIRRLKAP